MSINWTKKNFTALKWLGAGPAFLLYLMLMQDMEIFENGIKEGVFLSAIFILSPAIIIFLVYWPTMKASTIERVEEEKENRENICHLCGHSIAKKDLSKEHLPAKSFFPKEIRIEENLNLLTIPSHRECNKAYSEDEEHFYFSLFPIVRESKASISDVLYSDLKNKAQKEPQKRFAKTLLDNFSVCTDGGIYLPRGKYEYSINMYRIQRVVFKIIQGLFFYHNQMFLPTEKIKHFDMCLDDAETLEVFRISWQGSELTYRCKQVFSYKYLSDENRHYWTLLFWDAAMFTVMAEHE